MTSKRTTLTRIPLNLWDGDGVKELTHVNLTTDQTGALNATTALYRETFECRDGRATLIREAAMGILGDSNRAIRLAKVGRSQLPELSIGQAAAALIDRALDAYEAAE